VTTAQQRAHARAREHLAFNASLVLAGVLHAALALALRAQPALPRALRVTEVELTPEPPPPAPPPPVAPPPPAVQPSEPPPPRARAYPPAPARAGALLTAPEPETAPAAEEPVRFATDPNGVGFGYGLVARGGTAEHGLEAAANAAPAPPPAQPRERIVPSDELAHPPTLVDADCRGYFPARALEDLGLVSLVALVAPSGAVARLEVERETPEGQGFAAAARACLQRQRFSPAIDRSGRAALARTRISIRFAR
jgi:hypothetical protein